jgi:hypothetical protein
VSRIPKVAVAVVAIVVVAVGAVVVYRETDLLTGSLVVLAALLICALVARRAAVREERAGMADWTEESKASAAAADDLFGEWAVTSPRERPEQPPEPQLGDLAPVVDTRPIDEAPEPTGAGTALDADPSPSFPAPAPITGAPVADTAPVAAPDDRPVEADRRTPAMAGAATGDRSSLIDWRGGQAPIDEAVRSSDDILRASEATALPTEASGAGGELARLLSKVEARLRDYE